MPRVTVSRDSQTVTPLPTPEIQQLEPVSDVPLMDQQADAPPPVDLVLQPSSVQRVVREIKTVRVLSARVREGFSGGGYRWLS